MRLRANWHVEILRFPGAAMPKLLALLEMLEVRKKDQCDLHNSRYELQDYAKGGFQKRISKCGFPAQRKTGLGRPGGVPTLSITGAIQANSCAFW